MNLFKVPILLFCLQISLLPDFCMGSSLDTLKPYQVIFGWRYIDFLFPSGTREKQLKSGGYIPSNCAIAGMRIHDSRMFLTVARENPGVPSTLNAVVFDETRGLDYGFQSPLLEAYPSWNMQEIGNCEAIQYAISLEIDAFGRLWVFDIGRINLREKPRNLCPAKILVFDLESDVIVAKHVFPANVVSPTSNFLDDIVVGCDRWNSYDCWAYLTDTNDAKLVVFSLLRNRSWFVKHKTMNPEPGTEIIPISGKNYNFTVPINGIALSPKASNHDRVYYTPVSSFSLYSVPTSILKKEPSLKEAMLNDNDVTIHTKNRTSQSDGMIMDSKGHLYYGALQKNAAVFVNLTSQSKEEKGVYNEWELIHNDTDLQWIESFAISEGGYLYMISNRLHKHFDGTMDWEDVNFRVVRTFIGAKSYVHFTKTPSLFSN